MKRIVFLFLGLALCLTATACSRLETSRLGEFPKERLGSRDAIPADYGDLIGVSPQLENPAWARAWFMRADKSIVIVSINPGTGDVRDEVLVIPRR